MTTTYVEFKEEDLVLLRLECPYGYTNTWWRVMFIDTDGTFIGKLERKHWHEYKAHSIGDHDRLDCNKVQRVYQEGEQFCYGDKITICTCKGVCRNK